MCSCTASHLGTSLPGSSVFEVGGYEWKLEMYPYGDSQSDKTLSVFLCAVDRKQLPGWSQTAHYQIAVVNNDPSKTSTHTGYDIFRGKRDSAVSYISDFACPPPPSSDLACCTLLGISRNEAFDCFPCSGVGASSSVLGSCTMLLRGGLMRTGR
jgi:hypothetical protein